MLAVAGVLIVATAWIAYSLARVEPGVLALHDGCWTYTTRRVSGEASDSGPLAVALDLGSFLLLTMTRAGARGPQARRWIPVQRHGLDGDWHALRCAVYSPPPAAPRVSASDGSGTE